MLAKDTLHKELNDLPDEYAAEVLDFVHFLKEKLKRRNLETTLLSESSLKKDWLLPEEDEAWQNL